MELTSKTSNKLINHETRCAFCSTTVIHQFLEWTTSNIAKFKCAACNNDFYINSFDLSSYGASESNSPDAFWVPYGKSVTYEGYTIPGGLIYFGSGLKSFCRDLSVETALIDPALPVDKVLPDISINHLGVLLSYSRLHPSSRVAYLEWLSNGKKDTEANLSYVFIYFYGLQRRVLIDAKDSVLARADFPIIYEEVKRLLSIYGEDSHFRGTANKLIDCLHASLPFEPLYLTTPRLRSCFSGEPLSLRLTLGQVARDNVPLSAEWALAWAENGCWMPRKTPTKCCREEFRELFKMRYEERFGNGLILKNNGVILQVDFWKYTDETVEIPTPNIPDMTRTPEESIICDIVVACTNELEGYSRYLSRNPNGKDSLEAASLLPKPIINKFAGEEFQYLNNWLTDLVFFNTPALVSFSSILQQIPSIVEDSFGKKEVTTLATLLGKINIGIEPDPRFGIFTPKPEHDVVLFKMSDDAPIAPSTEYSAATVVIHLAAAVAHADGTVDPAEKHHLEQHIETILHLTDDEKMRLRAHAQWLLSSFPGMDGVKKRIASLNQSERESLGTFLVGIAHADGYIDPAEVTILGKIYEMLGLDTQSLYSHAHTAAIAPVTVQKADVAQSKGYAIPSPPPKPDKTFSLDMNIIETKLAETVAVSAILNNIFKEDEPIQPAASDLTKSATTIPISGLDSDSFTFMQILASKLVWERGELEKLAADHNLMLDGTLDSINDASFDHFGGPFFEGDESIEINAVFAKELSI